MGKSTISMAMFNSYVKLLSLLLLLLTYQLSVDFFWVTPRLAGGKGYLRAAVTFEAEDGVAWKNPAGWFIAWKIPNKNG